jgi:hypothetical protein
VYPLFSQTGDGRISSTDPDLFADDGLEGLYDCVGGEPAVWLQDKRRSLDQVQQASGDLALKRDRTGPRQLNLFMKGQAIMDGVDHDDLLLRILIGESSHRLSTRFFMDRLTVNNIVHVLGARYPRVFHYVSDAKAQGLKHGVRRTRRPAPILRWFWEFEHGEAEHGTSTCLSMVTAVLSVGREDANRHASLSSRWAHH